jgi:hypothetical protein
MGSLAGLFTVGAVSALSASMLVVAPATADTPNVPASSATTRASSESETRGDARTTGLRIKVQGAPPGARKIVKVTGPKQRSKGKRYSKVIHGSKTLKVHPGKYKIKSRTVAATGGTHVPKKTMKKVRVRKNKLRSFKARYTFVATVVLPTPEQLGSPACADTTRLNMCVYVDNAAQMWQAPTSGAAPETTAVPWPQDAAGRVDSLGCYGNPSWDKSAAPGKNLAAIYESCYAGIEQTTAYEAPAVLGDSLNVSMYAYIPYLGSLTQTCKNTDYVICASSNSGDTWSQTFNFRFQVNPVLVQVQNSVKTPDGTGVGVTRDQDVTSNDMIKDSVVPDPKAVSAGATGYYGLYRKVAGSPTFSAIYTVDKTDDQDLAGGRFFINIAIDPATGLPTAEQKCTWQGTGAGGPSAAGTCNLVTTGGGGNGGLTVITATLLGQDQ